MPRDPRLYITVHNGMPDHPKVAGLSDGGFRLLVSMWCWCSRNETDGKVKAAIWTRQGDAKSRRELIAEGLVERDGKDFLMHDYLEHQMSAQEIADIRAKRQAAGRKGGKAKASALASAKQVPEPAPSKPVADLDSKKPTYSPTSTGNGNVPVGAAARIVKAYVESAKANDIPTPDESQNAVSRSARSLLDQGFSEEDVLEAARNAAVGGWTNLAAQLQRDSARANPTATVQSVGEQRAHGAMEAARLVALEDHRNGRAIG